MQNKFWVGVSLVILFFNPVIGTVIYAVEENNSSEVEISDQLDGNVPVIDNVKPDMAFSATLDLERKGEVESPQGADNGLNEKQEKSQNSKDDSELENSSSISEGTWGSSAVEYDGETKTLTIHEGTIGGEKIGFSSNEVERIVVMPGVILPENSEFLFGRSSYGEEGNVNRFEGLYSLTGIENFDTSNVTNMRGMFFKSMILDNASDLAGISGWDTSKVTDMSSMFKQSDIGNFFDLSGWDTSNVINMSEMFSETYNMKYGPRFSNWDTSKVTDMSSMFYYSSQLKSIDFSGWNTSQVLDMRDMFYGSMDVKTIKLGKNSIFNATVHLSDIAGSRYERYYSRRWIDKETEIAYDSSEVFMDTYDGTHPGIYTWERFYPYMIVKDSTINIGDTWSPADNFVSASRSYNNLIDISYITVTGTVDTEKAGIYKIEYFINVGFNPNFAEVKKDKFDEVDEDDGPIGVRSLYAVAYVTVVDKPEPTKPEPTKPEPTKPEPTKPEPTKLFKKNTYNQSGTSKLPETGEIVDGSIILTGVIVVMTSTLLFVLRKKYQGIHK